MDTDQKKDPNLIEKIWGDINPPAYAQEDRPRLRLPQLAGDIKKDVVSINIKLKVQGSDQNNAKILKFIGAITQTKTQ